MGRQRLEAGGGVDRESQRAAPGSATTKSIAGVGNPSLRPRNLGLSIRILYVVAITLLVIRIDDPAIFDHVQLLHFTITVLLFS